MAPLRDAVSLVNGEKGYLKLLEEFYGIGTGKGFGSHIEHLGAPLEEVFFDVSHLLFVKRGVEEVGHIVVAGVVTHGVDLILHKGYKRRDNDGGTLTDDGRKLVAKRLATACRHNHEGVVAVEQTLDYGFLVTLEVVKSENLFQFRLQYAAICVQYD